MAWTRPTWLLLLVVGSELRNSGSGITLIPHMGYWIQLANHLPVDRTWYFIIHPTREHLQITLCDGSSKSVKQICRKANSTLCLFLHRWHLHYKSEDDFCSLFFFFIPPPPARWWTLPILLLLMGVYSEMASQCSLLTATLGRPFTSSSW